MDQCREAYVDPCTECAQLENCSPSMCQKLNDLESELREVKMILQELVDKVKYYYGI
ncbi:hypothetical protein ACOBQJ_08020 [Pelotomaculum propionicicum]|uniref:hypothetical protein n=1 Tax=Pelotomaculum propionicicum TaxID=258475 RepID=UPI003B7DDE68